MSPTIFQYRQFRFFFFSREEPRMHVHVYSPKGEAKFWLSPEISLAVNYGFSSKDLKTIEKRILEHEDEIKKAWREHFGS